MTETPAPLLDMETVESRSFKYKNSAKKERKVAPQEKKPTTGAGPTASSSSTRRDATHRRGASGGPHPTTTSSHRENKVRSGKHAHLLSRSTETILFHSEHDPNPIVPNRDPGTPDVWVLRTIRA